MINNHNHQNKNKKRRRRNYNNAIIRRRANRLGVLE